MTLVPLNMLQRTDDPELNPHLSSPSVSLSQPRTGHGTGVSAVLATVGEVPHGSRTTSSRFYTLELGLRFFFLFLSHMVST